MNGGLDRQTWRSHSNYELLELPHDASVEEITAAWRLLSVAWDPARFDKATWKRIATERLDRLKEAYECLTDDEARTSYDRELASASSGSPSAFAEPSQSDPAAWKRLAAWMKVKEVGTGFHRKMAFIAGDCLERRKAPTDKQLPYMLDAWTTGVRAGFDPKAVPP